MNSRANNGSFFMKMRIAIIEKSVIFTPLNQIFVKQKNRDEIYRIEFSLIPNAKSILYLTPAEAE